MFGGIVPCFCVVREVELSESQMRLTLAIPNSCAFGLALGASVAVDGVCLTVVSIEAEGTSSLERSQVGDALASPVNETQTSLIQFDVVQETLSRSTLRTLKPGSTVNVERSLLVGDERGGHDLSGHIDGTAEIATLTTRSEAADMQLKVPNHLMKYIFEKGYIALNGVSLTVGLVDRERAAFHVHLIPETLRRTTFHQKAEGMRVNVEVDRSTQVTVDSVTAWLSREVSPLIQTASQFDELKALLVTHLMGRQGR